MYALHDPVIGQFWQQLALIIAVKAGHVEHCDLVRSMTTLDYSARLCNA